ncbi:hypothetical protein BLSTO_03980 [Blastocystis sp. subtype 1]
MVHIISSVISGQSFMLVQVNHNHNQFDARLTRCVFLLHKAVSERQQHPSNPYRCSPHLEIAFLSFFLVFRRTFINDQKSFAILKSYEDAKNEGIPPRAAAYRDFFTEVGFLDNLNALGVIWEEVCRNLRSWCDNETVINESLKLLLDITNGYESSKMLLRLDSVTYVLQHHTEQEFPFLLSASFSHLRSIYYQSLTNLILLNSVPGRLEVLLSPVVERIAKLSATTTFSSEDCMMIVNVFRDARGVVNSCTSKRAFNVFFEALYPKAFEVMRHALRERGNEEEIVSSIMKFLSSLVLNRESRIDYCNELANGVTLFRETASVLQVYGNLLLENFKSFSQCPDYVYKGICQLFNVMQRCLKGNYIPFGVFSLYNDNCLQDVLSMYLQIVIRTPFDQLSQWPKYETAVFNFLDVLFSDHLATVTAIGTESFITIMGSICHGISSFNLEVVKSSAHILDTVASYLYFNQYKNTEVISNIKRILVAQPNFWDVVMTSVLDAFIFGPSVTCWDLSRPIFSIYLVKREALDAYLTLASANQQQAVVQQLMSDTKALTTGIDFALGERSREEFSKKAMTWRRKFLSYMQL